VPATGREIIGCVRYAPLEALSHSRIRDIDPIAAAHIVTELCCADAEILEGARLFVDPVWQHHGLASDLLLAGTALAPARPARDLGNGRCSRRPGTRVLAPRLSLRRPADPGTALRRRPAHHLLRARSHPASTHSR